MRNICNKNHKITSLLTVVFLLIFMNACSRGPTQSDSPAGFTFTDDLGREVVVSEPQRTAALLGSFADVWYLAGGTVVASADDAWEDFDLSLPKDAVNLGMTKRPSMEALFSSQPDFILASANTQLHLDWMDTLDAAKIPTAYFDVSDFPDYLRLLELCTRITGREDLYEANGLAVQEQINRVIISSQQRLQNTEAAPTVLNLRASATYIRAKNSTGNVLGEMLKALGCINIADSDISLLENLSVEHILLQDPDFIFIVQQGDDPEAIRKHVDAFFAQQPALAQLTAVKEGRVFIMDKALYSLKPNARWGEAYEKLEAILANENG